MARTVHRPDTPRRRKPDTPGHPYRPTLTPGGTWCTHPTGRGQTCGQPENHPIHQTGNTAA